MKAGVPYATAWEMPDDERMASLIILGELDGGTWDWGKLRWIEKT